MLNLKKTKFKKSKYDEMKRKVNRNEIRKILIKCEILQYRNESNCQLQTSLYI